MPRRSCCALRGSPERSDARRREGCGVSEFNGCVVGGREPSAGAKPVSPSDLKEFKPILKVQYTIQLNASQGAPRREAPVRAAN